MPTYEYRCAGCGYEFEKFQSMTASALRKCPQCGKLALKRLIGAGAGVIFKGSGFYETDYRNESYKNAVKSESGSQKTSKKDAKTESKTDSGTSQGEKKPTKPKSEKKSS
ncbi:MAG: zinc ribbon domain-containing protein [Sedimentisphaerales bacterium]